MASSQKKSATQQKSGKVKAQQKPAQLMVPARGGAPPATMESVFRLSPCARKYIDSLIDPFEGPGDACVPMFPSFPSLKLRVFSRGTVTVGTSGVGFVLAQHTPANDVDNVFITGGGYAGVTITSAAAGVTAARNNSPYLATDFGASQGKAQNRVVSWGIRVRYTGTRLNMGGTIIALHEPDHQSLNNFTEANLLAFERAHRFAVTDTAWTQVCYQPIATDEFNYLGTGAAGNPYLGLFIKSTSQNTFEYECYLNYEVIGSNVRGKTPNDVDPQGTLVVTGALTQVNDGQIDRRLVNMSSGKASSHMIPALVGAIGKYASKVVSGFLPKAAAAGVKALELGLLSLL